MCELLRCARKLAKEKGLDPRLVYCSPDYQVICTGTGCLITELGIEASEPAQIGPLERFYQRAQKSLALMRK